MEEMTCKEIARLIEWLKSKGHTPDEIIACIEQVMKMACGNADQATPQAKITRPAGSLTPAVP